MSKLITELTPAQERELIEVREEALAYGRSTEPADRPTAETAITAMYARLGKPKPIFVWVDSPWAVCLAGGICELLLKNDQLRDQLYDQLYGQLRDQLRDQLRGQLRDQLRGQLRDQLYDQLYGQLRGQLRGQLYDQLYGQLRDQLRDQLRGQLRGQLRDQLYGQLRGQLRDQLGLLFWGQHELAWLTFYEFAGRVGVKYKAPDAEALGWWLRIGQSSCWWQPRNGIVLMSDRAEQLHIDHAGRLDRNDGPAMKFRDGYALWSIGGVVVDEQIVMRPETQTVKQIDDEQNNDVRSIRADRIGWANYLERSGAMKIDTRLHPRDGTNETLYRDRRGLHRLVSIDPATEKRVALGVPRGVVTCAQAQNWLSHGADELAMCRT